MPRPLVSDSSPGEITRITSLLGACPARRFAALAEQYREQGFDLGVAVATLSACKLMLDITGGPETAFQVACEHAEKLGCMEALYWHADALVLAYAAALRIRINEGADPEAYNPTNYLRYDEPLRTIYSATVKALRKVKRTDKLLEAYLVGSSGIPTYALTRIYGSSEFALELPIEEIT